MAMSGTVAATMLAACLGQTPHDDTGAQAPALEPPSGPFFYQDVAWSPDGRRIAFSEYAAGEEYDPADWGIHVIDVESGERRRLIDNAIWVSWAPGGDRLVIASSRDGDWEIYTTSAAGSDVTRLTHDAARDSHPAWSPRGDLIAFSSDRDGDDAIYVMTPDGSQARRLTRGPGHDYNPFWSPDGTHVVFFREKGDGKDQVHVVAADGSGERRVTNGSGHNTFPAFLPDGRIAFASTAPDGGEWIFTVAADGSKRARVGELRTFFARWSPDGLTIAFIAGGWPRSAIYLADEGGTNVRKLVN